MVYSFSGTEFEIKRDRFCVFWAAFPHRSVRVNADGYITKVYISFSEFLQWKLPAAFVNKLLNGAVLSTSVEQRGDREMTDRWANEINRTEVEWQKLHVTEIQGRLRRMSLEGWDVLHLPKHAGTEKIIGGNAILQFEKMLRYVAEHFADPITSSDVAFSERTGDSPTAFRGQHHQ
jgi:AraC family transcriptional regulator, melibiose operon regulatory protein